MIGYQKPSEIKTGMNMYFVCQIGTFLSRLEYIFLTGKPFHNFDKRKEYLEISAAKLWRLLDINWPFPTLEQWTNLGLPYAFDKNGKMIFKQEDVLYWTYKLRVVLSNIEYRINHTLPELEEGKKNVIGLDPTAGHYYKAFTEGFSLRPKKYSRLQIFQYDDHLIIAPRLKDSQFFDSYLFKAYYGDQRVYWEHVRLYDANEMVDFLYDVAQISKKSVLDTNGYIPILPMYDSFDESELITNSNFFEVANKTIRLFKAHSYLFEKKSKYFNRAMDSYKNSRCL